MKILKVNEKYNNKKLINFLQDNFDGLTTSTIYKALRKKDIRINDKRISENCLLKIGDDVKIYISDNLLQKYIASYQETLSTGKSEPFIQLGFSYIMYS